MKKDITKKQSDVERITNTIFEEAWLKRTKRLLSKYEKQYEEMIVMDDYDGGQKESLLVIIEDLKKVVKRSGEVVELVDTTDLKSVGF